MRLLLGTRNAAKLEEIRSILGDLPKLELVTYEAFPFSEVVEDRPSFEGNARKKARQICRETGLPTLAEDAGLEVEALGGAPGVHSARYAGGGGRADDAANNAKLLDALRGAPASDRRARFVCVAVIAFPDGREWVAQGELEGQIVHAPRGQGGFGYDPLFVPAGYDRTLAELGPQVKNRISHRAQALRRLRDRLKALLQV